MNLLMGAKISKLKSLIEKQISGQILSIKLAKKEIESSKKS